nr:MAG TPA: hypothetical protein [Caudoviricetes sp.]
MRAARACSKRQRSRIFPATRSRAARGARRSRRTASASGSWRRWWRSCCSEVRANDLGAEAAVPRGAPPGERRGDAGKRAGGLPEADGGGKGHRAGAYPAELSGTEQKDRQAKCLPVLLLLCRIVRFEGRTLLYLLADAGDVVVGDLDGDDLQQLVPNRRSKGFLQGGQTAGSRLAGRIGGVAGGIRFRQLDRQQNEPGLLLRGIPVIVDLGEHVVQTEHIHAHHAEARGYLYELLAQRGAIVAIEDDVLLHDGVDVHEGVGKFGGSCYAVFGYLKHLAIAVETERFDAGQQPVAKHGLRRTAAPRFRSGGGRRLGRLRRGGVGGKLRPLLFVDLVRLCRFCTDQAQQLLPCGHTENSGIMVCHGAGNDCCQLGAQLLVLRRDLPQPFLLRLLFLLERQEVSELEAVKDFGQRQNDQQDNEDHALARQREPLAGPRGQEHKDSDEYNQQDDKCSCKLVRLFFCAFLFHSGTLLSKCESSELDKADCIEGQQTDGVGGDGGPAEAQQSEPRQPQPGKQQVAGAVEYLGQQRPADGAGLQHHGLGHAARDTDSGGQVGEKNVGRGTFIQRGVQQPCKPRSEEPAAQQEHGKAGQRAAVDDGEELFGRLEVLLGKIPQQHPRDGHHDDAGALAEKGGRGVVGHPLPAKDGIENHPVGVGQEVADEVGGHVGQKGGRRGGKERRARERLAGKRRCFPDEQKPGPLPHQKHGGPQLRRGKQQRGGAVGGAGRHIAP